MDGDRHGIGGDGLFATVTAAGAELVSLVAGGREFLWRGDPAWWGRQAPILFPVVGRLQDDALRHRGHVHSIPQHGFARDRLFAWVERDARRCVLRLSDDEETRARFPFPFDLRVVYEIGDGRLDVTFRVSNPGTEDLPFGIGAHPGIVWPLAPGVPRDAHEIVFSDAEGPEIRRVKGALLDPAARPSPVAGRRLALHDGLFENDALIFDPLASRSLVFTAPGAPRVEIGWDGFPHLGIWSKPGAPFLCVEPWQSYVAPAGLAGDFAEKPGLAILAPGASREWRHWFRVSPAR